MKGFRLTEKEINQITEEYPTPFLVSSLEEMRDNYRFLRKHLPKTGIYYAMKANPTPAMLQCMYEMGASFDVASAGEMEQLCALGIPGKRMIYANPVKDVRGLAMAEKLGIQRYTFDDKSEISKIAARIPDAEVMVRIRVVNRHVLVDLNTKFGAAPEEALDLLQMAGHAGLKPIGICFHVGSQSLSTEAYEDALELCRELFDEAEARGMHLTHLDIGGGLPVPSAEGLPVNLENMLETIHARMEALFPDTDIWMEPGRFLCGTAVNLVTSVIGTKERNGQAWYVLDEGIYGALSGIIFDHWTYPMHWFRTGEERISSFVGPSCDSIDVLRRDIMVPRLYIGDKVLFTNIGAYSSVSASRFNGFEIAPTLIWEDLIWENLSTDLKKEELVS